MNITLRQLIYFRSLARHRNFGRAAEALHISQPALSVQIREFEATLGASVVERRARDIALTPFGRRVLAHANRVLAEMQALEETARWRGGLAGELSLGIIPTIAPYILPGALARLRSRDISLDVRVREARTEDLASDLRAGRIDVALMALPLPCEGLEAVALFEDRFLLAGSAARLAALGDSLDALDPKALGQSPILLLEDGHCLTDQALEVCGRARGHAQIDTGASSLGTLSRLVAAGFGLTLIPEMAAATEARAAPGLELRRFAAPEPARRIALVRRAGAGPAQWFDDLAEILRAAGEAATKTARDVNAASRRTPGHS
ncbi:hydrogen peroxide-inducible genes activator [Roseovarius autotrophicus]|uniref:hydrogen peroxide-inducible genes activator n=1 Tax=Roseovarius autotrophicus TaxID=2824121 RepID=UPI0019EBD61B|nr:hydrogen peroxide-inducible genes activator [Roseovarius autotrophicus]MBE0452132.1 LysR family transcriptional regulator [Roseovarius sp.]